MRQDYNNREDVEGSCVESKHAAVKKLNAKRLCAELRFQGFIVFRVYLPVGQNRDISGQIILKTGISCYFWELP